MRRSGRIGFAFMVAGLLAPALHAADAGGNFAIRGVGAYSCGDILQAIDNDDAAMREGVVVSLATWLGGYLTHANRVIDGRFEAVPFVSDLDMLALVLDRCRAGTDLPFEIAASEVLAILLPFGTPELSPVADLPDPVAMRAHTVVALQRVLIERGYLEGAADGIVGPLTRRAIARFNRDRSIAGGDRIGIETVLGLLGEEP